MAGPGVIVTTDQRPAATDRNPDPSGRFFIAGTAERGPTDRAVLVSSMSQFAQVFGDYVSYGTLYDAANVAFASGSGEVAVARVVGPAATKGFLNLADRAGSPLTTLKVEARGAGASSADISVAVRNGVVTGTFHIDIYVDAVQQESYGPFTDPASAVNGAASSQYVVITNQASATTAPNNNPAVLTRTALSSGADDRASITDTHRVNALALFTEDLGTGLVAIPGVSSTTVNQGLMTHAATNLRLAAVKSAQGAAVATAASDALALRTQSGADATLFLYPWLTISDGSGGTRTVSPEAYGAGRRAYTARVRGVWQPAAGTIYGQSNNGLVTGLERTLLSDDVNTLDAAQVSPIVLRTRPTIYGWNSLSPDTFSFGLVSIRDLLNYLSAEGERRLERFLFLPISIELADGIENEIRAMVQPIADAGGLAPLGESDPGYLVDAGPSLNPISLQQTNTVKVALSVRPAGSAKTIYLLISKTAPGVP